MEGIALKRALAIGHSERGPWRLATPETKPLAPASRTDLKMHSSMAA
eukprot:CAMPEP_0115708440 /NCGR_PEP_ID=MMETSP0272-20121206/71912_1 /TAXON_ID=71861 /ORGANISM="Scrippsiella trochoidea, Strain CCMP3099" /LENGTH=46 /DNA_ID= /DNA_START= /DNA_END= /DNA_ORIENTATION=